MDTTHRRRQLIPILLLGLILAPASYPSHAGSLTVLTQNLERLFDDVDDGNRELRLSSTRFNQRLERVADAFGSVFGLPQIIALQEVENRNVLERIAEQLRRRHAVNYQALLIPGNDVSGINLGYLVRDDLRVQRLDALFADRRFGETAESLFSRPPLRLVACLATRCFELLNLHLRSMRGIDNARRGARVRDKRRRQAEAVAAWLNRRQHAADRPALLVLGDFNALTPADTHVDVVGIIRGNPANRGVRVAGRDLLEPDLVDLSASIPAPQRFSYVYRQRRQQLDYLLRNRDFGARVERIGFAEIDYRLSDHAGLAATFAW